MPCYQGNDTIVYTTYPRGCTTSSPCSTGGCTYPIRSEYLYYSGANLPWTGINTLETITVALQRIDDKINPTSMLTQILAVLNTNPTLKAELCAALADC